MPTKQQYLQNYRNIASQKAELDEKHTAKYNEMMNAVRQGKSSKQWIEEQKKAVNNEKANYIEDDKYWNTYEKAQEFVKNKIDRLYDEATKKIEELEPQIKDANQKNYVRKAVELDAQKDYYNMSLANLKFAGGEEVRSYPDYSNEIKGWSVSLSDYGPYRPYAKKIKEFDDKIKDLNEFEEAVNNNDRQYKETVNHEKFLLNDKKRMFNQLNGWQKFWARVLPAGWYKNAELYADMKAQESAMKEVGMIDKNGNIIEPDKAVEQPVAEPLPEEEISDLQQKTELNQIARSQKTQEHFEEKQKETDLDESLDMYDEPDFGDGPDFNDGY